MAASTKMKFSLKISEKHEKKHVCSFENCQKTFSKRNRLIIHLRTHTGEKPYSCDFEGCDKAYARSSHLARHVENSHSECPVVKKDEIICPHEDCRSTFVSDWNLRKHLNTTHTRLHYKCPFDGCDKVFKKHQHLKTHEFVHTNVKPYQCEFEGCEAAFVIHSKLKRHLKIHEGYNCPREGCDKHFEKWSLVRKHLAEDHKSEHRCPTCNKSFPHERVLALHVMIHEETRTLYICPKADCSREYYNKKNLTAHIKSFHEGSRFSCTHEGCDKDYANKQKMLKHLRTHDPNHVVTPKKKPNLKKDWRKISEASRLSLLDAKTQGSVEVDPEDRIILPERDAKVKKKRKSKTETLTKEDEVSNCADDIGRMTAALSLPEEKEMDVSEAKSNCAHDSKSDVSEKEPRSVENCKLASDSQNVSLGDSGHFSVVEGESSLDSCDSIGQEAMDTNDNELKRVDFSGAPNVETSTHE